MIDRSCISVSPIISINARVKRVKVTDLETFVTMHTGRSFATSNALEDDDGTFAGRAVAAGCATGQSR